MGDTKGDPILRVVLVVVVGLFVFNFLFSGSFGGSFGGSAGHHGMGAGGYGGSLFSGMFTGLIGFLMHLLILVLIFSLIGGLILGIRKVVKEQSGRLQSSKAVEYINQDPVLRTMAIALAVVFGLYFVSAIFNGMQFGYGAASPQFMLYMLFGFLMKLLMLGLVVSLIVALVQFFRSQFMQAGSDNDFPVLNSGQNPQGKLSPPANQNNKPENK
jgi:predicted lipid-binding transport protein (Tim44 family)